ncbi:TPA: hypothetical protein ACH3X1_016470 [Trebouxia sp. C0004]
MSRLLEPERLAWKVFQLHHLSDAPRTRALAYRATILSHMSFSYQNHAAAAHWASSHGIWQGHVAHHKGMKVRVAQEQDIAIATVKKRHAQGVNKHGQPLKRLKSAS